MGAAGHDNTSWGLSKRGRRPGQRTSIQPIGSVCFLLTIGRPDNRILSMVENMCRAPQPSERCPPRANMPWPSRCPPLTQCPTRCAHARPTSQNSGGNAGAAIVTGHLYPRSVRSARGHPLALRSTKVLDSQSPATRGAAHTETPTCDNAGTSPRNLARPLSPPRLAPCSRSTWLTP